MIGYLPKSLIVDGREYAINSDFRPALRCIQAFEDGELTNSDKMVVLLRNIYIEAPENTQEAITQAIWFLDCGNESRIAEDRPRLMDWSKDEQYIFASMNRKVGYSVREVEYLHWWDFIGMFLEPDESMFSHIVTIRAKLRKGKKLDESEKGFYLEHKETIDLAREKDDNYESAVAVLTGPL
ncbi:MAG: bacteriophage Gp15 family protein [Clostridiales bacterium]|jgi:hypothetical protein|nr:bacteriophage Gp15 family protein [Clostridiales bacterium]